MRLAAKPYTFSWVSAIPKHSPVLATKLTLMFSDLLSVSAAYVLSYEIRNQFFFWRAAELYPSYRHLYLLTGVLVLLIVYFRHIGLYQRSAFNRSPDHLERLTRAWIQFSALLIAFAFFFRIRLFINYRITVSLLIILGWGFLYLGRFILAPFVVRRLYKKWDWTNRVLVAGGRVAALRMAEHIGLYRDSRDLLVGRIGEKANPEEGQICPYLGPLSALSEVVREKSIDEIFIHLDQHDWHAISRAIEEAREGGILVRVAMPHFGELREKVIGMPQIEQGYVYLQRSYFMPFERWIRRTLDTVGAGLLLVFLSPLFLLVALFIKLDSPGPVFFRQRRVGMNGRPFDVWKFRSMRQNTESQHRDSIRRLVNGGLADSSGMDRRKKWTDASQVTRFGRWLRRSSLDELPQLMNVLSGEMSLVGPRPLPTYEVEMLEPWQHLRHAVRPGITGFWQAYGRSIVSHRDMILMDIFYVVSWSLAMDIRIFVRTVFVVLTGRGAM